MNMSMSYVPESFATLYPNITVTLRGGGNDVAFARWIAGESDIGQASRKISTGERQQAEANGFNVTETKVAVESVAIITDPGAGVSQLTFEQLRGLFNGSIDNWNKVGGADLAVRAFIPTPQGSPYLFFNKSIMGTSSYGPTTVTVDNGPELVDRVTSTAGAVGFVRAGYVNSTADVTVVPVSASGGPAYDATDLDAAYNGSYALGRYYYLYTDGPLAGARGVWASFILDPEHGQRVLADHGFLPLRETDRENSTSNVAPDAAVTGYRIVRAAPDGSSREFNVNSTHFVDSGVPAGTSTYTVSAVYASGLADATPLTVTVPAGGTASTPSYFGLSAWTLVAVGLGVAAVVVVIAILARRR
jgi:phosphate transport system substrate-binding protein